MAGKDLNYRINVNAAAGTAGIKDFARAVKSELRNVDQSLEDTSSNAQKVAQSLGRMADQAEAELKAAAAAADALGQALGPELAATMGRDGIAQKVGELNRLGLTFDEIEQDADELAAAIRRIDQVQTSAQDQGLGALGSKAGSARGEIDQLSDSARGANSAMANMVGNTTQDLSGLAGVTGSLGVVFGQMGEYAADASIGAESLGSSLKSMAKVAGPIGALALVMQSVSDVQSRFADSSKRTAENVDAWTDALTEGGDAAENYADHLRDVGKVTLDVTRSQNAAQNATAELSDHWYSLGGGVGLVSKLLGATSEEVRDITPLLNAAGVSVDEWTKAITGNEHVNETFRASIAATNLSADDQKAILEALTQQQEDHTTAQDNAAARAQFLTAQVTEGTRAWQESERAIDAERRIHLQNNAAMYAATLQTNDLRDAQDRLEDAARNTALGFDAIRDSLQMEETVARFQENFLIAIDKVNRGIGLSGDEILGLKNDILDVAEYANLNPVQVKALLAEIDKGNIANVMTMAQYEINRYKLNAKVAVDISSTAIDLSGASRTQSGGKAAPDALGVTAFDAPVPAVSGSSTIDLGTLTVPVGGVPVTNVQVDFRGAILTSRHDFTRAVRSAVRAGVRLGGVR